VFLTELSCIHFMLLCYITAWLHEVCLCNCLAVELDSTVVLRMTEDMNSIVSRQSFWLASLVGVLSLYRGDGGVARIVYCVQRLDAGRKKAIYSMYISQKPFSEPWRIEALLRNWITHNP
jgi:hypothetical protein